MNILSDKSLKVERNSYTRILPFYRMKDLDTVCSEITLDKFEEYAEYRVKLYLQIDKNELSTDPKKIIDSEIRMNAEVMEQNREKDILSHFIMRAAFSSNGGDRAKFIDRESRLFAFRLEKYDIDEAYTNCDYGLKKEKSQTMNDLFSIIDHNEEYYSTDFENVPRQLSNRSVFLCKGKAYIPKKELKGFIISRFEDELASAIIDYASQNSKFMDPRLEPIFKQLTNIYIAEENIPTGSVTVAAIPRLCKQSFPLCMQRMYKRLSETNKLYYDGREQLGRFLKGIGLSMEGSLEFFQNQFTRSISVDKFSKEYSYNIRYMYGKEGRRVQLSPHSCAALIKSKPSGDQCHGCPFSCLRAPELEGLLKSMHVDNNHISDIMLYYREGNIEKACREHFLALHPGAVNEGIAMHPVLWYKKSRQYYEEKEEKKPQL